MSTPFIYRFRCSGEPSLFPSFGMGSPICFASAFINILGCSRNGSKQELNYTKYKDQSICRIIVACVMRKILKQCDGLPPTVAGLNA